MKHFKVLYFVLISLALSSCFKESKEIFKDTVVEFDYAVIKARTPGFDFPTIDADGNRGDTLRLRINLVGAQRGNDESIKVQAATYGTSDEYDPAVENKHFTFLNGGEFVIAKNSSFATCEIVLPENDDFGTFYFVVELVGNSGIRPSANYKKVGVKVTM
jgi:hypothetical protein